MEPLPGLIASFLSWLHGLGVPDACPGGWAWSTTGLGVLIGLLPTAGALAVALLRRRIGTGYTAGSGTAVVAIGVAAAGVIPWALFTATGSVFDRAAAGRPVPGLSRADLVDLARPSCLLDSQAGYLGGPTTAAAFDLGNPLWFGYALLVLVPLPLLVAIFVMVQARTALRRGSRWPSKFFWLPVVVLALLTWPMPAGATGQLWMGMVVGAFAGMFVVPMVGAPSRSPAPRRPARRRTAGERRAEPPPRPQLAATPGPLPVPRRARRDHPPTRVAPGPSATGEPRFRVVRRLGAGGFGRVWLAWDGRLGQPVALKAAHAPDTETEQRIRREARALATVRHPNCVRIHDLVQAAADPGLTSLSGLVIVMEYVDGPSLGESVLERGPIDDVTAAQIWIALAGALGAAHQRAVLHRDVKPGNVILDRTGRPHLIDFGIARSAGDATLTAAGFVLGTPDFLAPEVARGDPATPAADAWQLAATLSFALTGYPPRGGHADAMSGLRAAAAGAAPTHLPTGSAHRDLLRVALATDVRDRPTLSEVQGALAGWLRRGGVPGPRAVGAAAPGPAR